MRYMLIHTVPAELDIDEAQSASLDTSLTAWLDETISTGVNLQGSRVGPSSDATTVRSRKGELLVTDGPFAETTEQVAGYDVLECADLDAAVEWAAKHPTAQIGAIEVRRLLDSSPPVPLPEPKEGKIRYMLLICLGEDFHIGPQDEAGIGPATNAWVKETGASGTRLFGSQLEEPGHARTVRRKGDEMVVTDGPFAETKEMIAGFDVLECTDLDEAIEVAGRHPMARFGMLELRPFWSLHQS